MSPRQTPRYDDQDDFLFDITEIQSRGGEFKEIPLAKIDPNPEQPRKVFDKGALKELSLSIKKNGVLQPILVRPIDQGRYFLIAGERRYRASKMAELDDVPCIIWMGDENLDLELAITENLMRQDLNPVEEAHAIAKLKKLRKLTDKVVADLIGKSRTSITEILKLNDLPEQIKRACRSNDNPPAKSLLLHIARQGDKKSMIKAWEQYKNGNFSILKARATTKKKADTKKQVFRWDHKTDDYSVSIKLHEGNDPNQSIINALEAIIDELKKTNNLNR